MDDVKSLEGLRLALLGGSPVKFDLPNIDAFESGLECNLLSVAQLLYGSHKLSHTDKMYIGDTFIWAQNSSRKELDEDTVSGWTLLGWFYWLNFLWELKGGLSDQPSIDLKGEELKHRQNMLVGALHSFEKARDYELSHYVICTGGAKEALLVFAAAVFDDSCVNTAIEEIESVLELVGSMRRRLTGSGMVLTSSDVITYNGIGALIGNLLDTLKSVKENLL